MSPTPTLASDKSRLAVLLAHFGTIEAPCAHRLMAESDAACGQDLVHMPQAQGEAEIEPDRVADDLGREAVAGIAGTRRCRHPARLRDPAYLASCQPDGAVRLARNHDAVPSP
jgi:hypothetical protein